MSPKCPYCKRHLEEPLFTVQSDADGMPIFLVACPYCLTLLGVVRAG